jgi:predicted phage terminase large subunit-like protein
MISRLEVAKEKARRNLHEFVQQAWPVLEPQTPFVDGMHMHAVCEHLQAVSQGRIGNLIVNIPPGHAKSLLTAVFWPAWVWIDHPETRWLFSSYREPLAVRDSVKCRRLIESDWYQQCWGESYQLSADQNQKGRFENTRTGYRVVVPMSAGTGERGDYVVVDDPHSVDQAESETERRSAVEWWNGSMATRLNDLSTGHKIVIMQRLHESDLTGDLLAKGGYDWLCLPAEFEPERRCTTSIGWSDPRQELGELLWPEKVRAANLHDLKVTLGDYRYAAQYQQRPSPAEGGILKRGWFRFWRPAHQELPPVPVKMPDGQVRSIPALPLPPSFDDMVQSWDFAFKDLAHSDYVVGQVWAALGADRFLLDQQRERMDMPRSLEAIRMMSQRWPRAAAKLVEDKANGPAVIASLKHEISGLIAVNPEGGKIARASAISPQVEAGNVYLPHPALAPWVEAFLEECAGFPHAAHDDQVDAMTQALNRLHGVSRGIYPVAESELAIESIEIGWDWPRVYAMDVRLTELGALWAARNPQTKVWYVYSEYYQSHGEAAAHAQGIRSRGKWIPGLIDATANGRSESDGINLMCLYQELGLDLDLAPDSEQSGVCEVLQAIRSGRLKVVRSLENFFREYRLYQRDDEGRIIKRNDLLMNCLRHICVAGGNRMRTVPTLRQSGYTSYRSWPGMPGGWMG